MAKPEVPQEALDYIKGSTPAFYTLVERIREESDVEEEWKNWEHSVVVEEAIDEVLLQINNVPVTLNFAVNTLLHIALYSYLMGKDEGRLELSGFEQTES